MVVTPPQAIEAPLAKHNHVAMNRGPTEAHDLGGLLPRSPAVEQPENQHPLRDPEVGMRGPLLDDGRCCSSVSCTRNQAMVPLLASRHNEDYPCFSQKVTRTWTSWERLNEDSVTPGYLDGRRGRAAARPTRPLGRDEQERRQPGLRSDLRS